MPSADPTSAPVTTPTTILPTIDLPRPSARIIPFPTPPEPEPAPPSPAESLHRAAAALDEAARRLERQARFLATTRDGFEQAQRQLAVESERSRVIADNGARIAAAIEQGDLDALLALQRELADLSPVR